MIPPSLDVSSVKNEWMWHNVAYAFLIKKDSSRSVDAYLSSSDDNTLLALFFDFYRFWW